MQRTYEAFAGSLALSSWRHATTLFASLDWIEKNIQRALPYFICPLNPPSSFTHGLQACHLFMMPIVRLLEGYLPCRSYKISVTKNSCTVYSPLNPPGIYYKLGLVPPASIWLLRRVIRPRRSSRNVFCWVVLTVIYLAICVCLNQAHNAPNKCLRGQELMGPVGGGSIHKSTLEIGRLI